MDENNAAIKIERLLQFAYKHNMIKKLDIIPARNALMELLDVKYPYTGDLCFEIPDSPSDILNKLLDYAAEKGILVQNSTTYRDLLDAKIMGILMPRQSEVAEKFWDTAKYYSIKQATDQYYQLSKASNYIRMDRIEKNLYWKMTTEYGDIEITINLSKPEKDPKTIAMAKTAEQINYPKCLLCIENVGYSGRIDYPARQNHRVIPIKLNNEQWFMQYSPYVYYNEHCIVFCKDHVPMKISENTFIRLLDFVEQIPHYFLGSNADLPIVGGSILNHDHFQGGCHEFCIQNAMIENLFYHPNYPEIKVAIIKWPMSVIRLSGKNKHQIIKASIHIWKTWKEYSDYRCQIHAYTIEDGKKIPHNTVTPIARINKSGDFELDIVLRNNATSKEYPDGIFHPHKQLHHIKKENIGLIEVMGLAILPGRLQKELDSIMNILTGKVVYNESKIKSDHALKKHFLWIQSLVKKYGTQLTDENAKQVLQREVSQIFVQVLKDAGVFKRDNNGRNAFIKFMKYAGFTKL